jgi:mannose-6-phosphate isomerase-like protein (cupin superfamily)
MAALRLQGRDVGSATDFWVGLSHFLPGGGAERSAAPLDRVYVVIEGEVAIAAEDGAEVTLTRLDSCFVPRGETRTVRNRTNVPCSMLVVMPYPEEPV